MPITYLDDEQKKSKITYEEEPAKKRTVAEYILPSWATPGYKEKPGERTLWGDIGERPGKMAGAAIRRDPSLGVWGPAAGVPAFMGLLGRGAKEEATQAGLYPEEVPTFQESKLEAWAGKPYEIDPKTGQYAKPSLAEAISESAGGMALDIWTDPVTMILTMFGLSPGGKEAIGKIAATRGGQALKKLGETEIRLPKKQPAVAEQIKVMQKQFGLKPEKYPPKYLKTKISEIGREKGIQVKTKVDKVKLAAVQTVDDLKIQQKAFDKQLLKEGTDFAKYMKDAGPKWVREGTAKYGQLLDEIGNSVGKEFSLTPERIVNYLDDLIGSIEGSGLQGRILNDLRALRINYANQYPRGFVNFGKLKSQMSSVYKQMSPQLKNGVGMTSDDVMISMTKSKWMDFLGTVMPETEKAKFLVMQNKYRQFAEAKKAMGKAFHPYSGEYDMTKGINSALQFAEQRKAEGLNNLMKTLETGVDDFVPGVQDIKMKSQTLLELGKKKAAVKETIVATQKAKTVAINKINKEKSAYVDEVFGWKRKADDLLAQQAQKEMQRGKLVKALRDLFFLGAGFETARRILKK